MNRQDASRLVQSLFLSWYPSLVRYACRACGQIETAEDAVQEAFMALYRELVRGVEIQNPEGWTLVVVRREVGRRQRSEKRSREGLERWVAQASISEDAGALDRVASADDLTRRFAVLSQREEEVLLLRLQAFRYDEIARQLEISRNSVKTLLARAFRKLRLASGDAAPGSQGDATWLSEHDDVSQTLH